MKSDESDREIVEVLLWLDSSLSNDSFHVWGSSSFHLQRKEGKKEELGKLIQSLSFAWSVSKKEAECESHLSLSFFFDWLLVLWSDFCSKLPNKAFSSFALPRQQHQQKPSQTLLKLKNKRRIRKKEKRAAPSCPESSLGSHLSRQVMGSESSPLHILIIIPAGWPFQRTSVCVCLSGSDFVWVCAWAAWECGAL